MQILPLFLKPCSQFFQLVIVCLALANLWRTLFLNLYGINLISPNSGKILSYMSGQIIVESRYLRPTRNVLCTLDLNKLNEEWLQSHDISPKTGLPLVNKQLTPNWDKKSEITDFLEQHPETYETTEIYLPKSTDVRKNFEFSDTINCMFENHFELHVYKKDGLEEAIAEDSVFSEAYENTLRSGILINQLRRDMSLDLQWAEVASRAKKQKSLPKSAVWGHLEKPFTKNYLLTMVQIKIRVL